MPVSLENQVVLVVGASSGIGRATATLFAAEGARVVAAARREERLTTLQQEVRQRGHSLAFVAGDAARAADAERMVAAALDRFGRVDIVVYAAGTNSPDRSMRRLTDEIWEQTLEVNLGGAYYVTRAALPAMRAAGSGYLIYVSSISAQVPDVSGAAYQASKRGLLGLAHAVRMEEKENGIRTCVICPGLVDTEMLNLRPVKTPAEVVAKALQPEDVAEVIVAVARLPARAVVPEMQLLPSYL